MPFLFIVLTLCRVSRRYSFLFGRKASKGLLLQLPRRVVVAAGVRLLGLAFVVDDGQVLAAHLLRLLVDGALGYAAFTARLCRLLLKGRKKA